MHSKTLPAIIAMILALTFAACERGEKGEKDEDEDEKAPTATTSTQPPVNLPPARPLPIISTAQRLVPCLRISLAHEPVEAR